MGHGAQEDPRGVVPAAERLDHRADAALEQVVAEVHTERVVPDERAGAPYRVRDPLRRALVDVRESDAEARAVSEEFPDLFRHVVPEDDPDLRNPGVTEVLDAVQDVRFVRDRDQLLWARMGQRAEPRAVASREDDALHSVRLMSPRVSRNVGCGILGNRSSRLETRQEVRGRGARRPASANVDAFRSEVGRPNVSQTASPIS